VTHRCPSCQRFFDETGFCPFDGKQLESVISDGAETLPSMVMPAASAAGKPTEVVSVAPAAVLPTFRALSASESTGAAMAAIQSRLSEYDRLVGQTLDGRYHIERKIGEGGMGVVFAARHAVIERPLAIKVLKREVMRDTATIKRFVQEAKAASRIGHPNIVDVTDFGTTTDGLTYQVMEYVDGVTLGGALRERGLFAIPRAVRIAGQLARALGAAHTKGIVHRDLKPENIFLLDRDGRKDFVKIVDFGIAKIVPVEGAPAVDGPRLTRAGAVFGTPEYMAPEQAAGRGDTDGRVDIYALGIILYEMLTGRVPHRGDTMVRTLAMQMLDPIEPPTKIRPDVGIRPELEAVVMKALAKKREHRYQSMAEMLADLERAGGASLTEPVSASTATASGKLFVLPAAPPGADPASAVPVPVPVRAEASSGARGAPTDSSPVRARNESGGRYRGEPAFVQGSSQVIEYSTDDYGTRPPPSPSRWPLVLGAAVVLAAGAVGIALYLRDRDDGTTVAATTFDASLAPPPVVDAAIVVVDTVPDAATAVVDAGSVATGERRDARVKGPSADAAIPSDVRLTPLGNVAVKVMTVPDGGTIYEGNGLKGPDRTTIEAPYGTRARYRCRRNGYTEGEVSVVFDGKTDTAVCHMKRIANCVDGTKNPFDDCPDARPD
jgi:serine/threonine protein kinase